MSCSACHTLEAWSPLKDSISFNHQTTTFPLEGAHRAVGCLSCHTNLTFKGTPNQCQSCHNDVHNGALGKSCEQCHQTSRWVDYAEFERRHQGTRFPLVGVHKGVSCQKCHGDGVFRSLSTQCVACHRADFDRTQNPDHRGAGFSLNCERCHNLEQARWAKVQFFHTDRFPLNGGHQGVTCLQCHPRGSDFTRTSADCYSCHKTDYEQATNPIHQGVSGRADFPLRCTDCHSASDWKPARFSHDLSRFPLTGAHQRADCQQCHQGRWSGVSQECYACHTDVYQRAQNPNHRALAFPYQCQSCHTVEAWRPSTFDHASTSFPLTGSHRNLDCARCHTTNLTSARSECISCHQADWDATRNPPHQERGFPTNCFVCHSTDDWRPAQLDHDRTRFPLQGAHRRTDCALCHQGNRYTGTPTDCWSCHESHYRSASDPNHISGNYSRQCDQCHNLEGWSPARFDHNLASFPLTGRHRTLQCGACHHGRFQGTPSDCWSCHQQDFDQTASPAHTENRLPHQCQNCHHTGAWKPSTFNHQTTQFPLTGKHQRTLCISCHQEGNYREISKLCLDCHRRDFASAANPSHEGNRLPSQCERCHLTEGWTPSTFNHQTTNFPLTGAHRSLQCRLCHIQGNYRELRTDCWSCHQRDFDRVAFPAHTENRFPTLCTNCHTVDRWRPAQFDHQRTRFPLTGRHRNVECIACHVGGQYANNPTQCYSCHQRDYENVRDPDHRLNNYDQNCSVCHTTDDWQVTNFNHNLTRWPLQGAHNGVACARCHTGQFRGTPTQCYSCHQDDYNNAQNPEHRNAGFPQECNSCHSLDGWRPAQFDHDRTQFPLRGAHRQVRCADCHLNGQYAGTPQECYFCHRADYENAQNPNHRNAGFSQECNSCHSVEAWRPAQFDHDRTQFPLTGAHRQVQCANCHQNDQYRGTPRECYPCHQADYANARNPEHRNAGYPLACQSCHTTNGWSPANFDHDGRWFPIYSGHHRGRWETCAICHTDPNNFRIFSCITCHEHDRDRMDREHREVRDYQYNSDACYRCHPRGGGDEMFQSPRSRPAR